MIETIDYIVAGAMLIFCFGWVGVTMINYKPKGE